MPAQALAAMQAKARKDAEDKKPGWVCPTCGQKVLQVSDELNDWKTVDGPKLCVFDFIEGLTK